MGDVQQEVGGRKTDVSDNVEFLLKEHLKNQLRAVLTVAFGERSSCMKLYRFIGANVFKD